MTIKQHVWALLDQDPTLRVAQLADLAGCAPKTAEAYLHDWRNRMPNVARCPTCGLAFELMNPKMVGGACLMCNLRALGIEPRDFYEAGGATHLVMRERPSVPAVGKRAWLRHEIELLQRKLGQGAGT